MSVRGVQVSPRETFYYLPGRAWELLVGALLAHAPPPKRPQESVAWAGLAAMLAAVLLFKEGTPFPGVAALLPCGGAALFIYANGTGLTRAGRLLACRPIVGLGLISYSWYLWHWPLFAFVRYWTPGEPASVVRWALVATSLLLAIATWKWVETPLRKVNRLRLAAAVWVLLVSAALLVDRFDGFPGRFPSEVVHYAETYDQQPPWIPQVTLAGAQRGDFVPLGARDTRKPVDFILWGDSHALAISSIFDELGKEYGRRGVAAAHGGTLPLLGYVSNGLFAMREASVPCNAAILSYIQENKLRHVFLVARWTNYPTENLAGSLQRTLQQLEEAGCTVWFLRQLPEHPQIVPRALARNALFGGKDEDIGTTLGQHRKRNAQFDQWLEAHSRAHTRILDPEPIFFRDGEHCRVSEAGAALFWDDNHPTVHGARLLRPLLEPAFKK